MARKTKRSSTRRRPMRGGAGILTIKYTKNGKVIAAPPADYAEFKKLIVTHLNSNKVEGVKDTDVWENLVAVNFSGEAVVPPKLYLPNDITAEFGFPTPGWNPSALIGDQVAKTIPKGMPYPSSPPPKSGPRGGPYGAGSKRKSRKTRKTRRRA